MQKWSTPEPETLPVVPGIGYLDAITASPHAVALPLLLPGTLVTLRTKNTLYRVVVVDGPKRQISVTGGRLFPQSTDVQLLGALDSDYGVKSGWIIEGLQLQMIGANGPVITSVVESVDVDVDPASLTGEETE